MESIIYQGKVIDTFVKHRFSQEDAIFIITVETEIGNIKVEMEYTETYLSKEFGINFDDDLVALLDGIIGRQCEIYKGKTKYHFKQFI